MKQVMVKAWEIAREGAKKFGGKASEYISEALKMAWEIVKSAMDKIKFQIVPASNGNFFAVLATEGRKVVQHLEFYSVTTRKVDKVDLPINTYAKNKKTGEEYAFYKYTPKAGKIVIEADGQKYIFENN